MCKRDKMVRSFFYKVENAKYKKIKNAEYKKINNNKSLKCRLFNLYHGYVYPH